MKNKGKGPAVERSSKAAGSRAGAGERLLERLPSLVGAWRGGVSSSPSSDAGAGVRALTGEEIDRASRNVLKLQRGLTSDRRLAGSGYMDEPGLLGAYVLYYWPVSYLQASLSLSMILPRLSRPVRRVLDLGSGPGPVAAAFIDAGATDLVLADGSGAALALAERLLDEPGLRLESKRVDFRRDAPPVRGPFDAIVASHLLNELWKGEDDRIERRLDFVEEQSRSLAADGFLLVIEPALLGTSRDCLALRDGLTLRGWRLIAPCPDSSPCPSLAAGEQRTCHGETSWEPPEPAAAIALHAGLDRGAVKWTWFCAAPPPGGVKPKAPPSEFPVEEPAVAAPTPTRRVVAKDRPKGSVGPARVVSEGMLNKAGRLRYLLCEGDRLTTVSAKADSPLAEKSGFTRLARLDLISVSGGETREGGVGLTETAKLTVIERAPSAGP